MSRAFELISESLTEIIDDLEKNGGKNLTQKIVEIEEKSKIDTKKFQDTKKYHSGFNGRLENVPV